MLLAASGLCILVILAAYPDGSCGIDRLTLAGGVESYESLDPVMCEDLAERIDGFNERCGPHVEPIDCG